VTALPDEDCLPERELAKLSNEQLLDYIVEQRDAGRPQCAKAALAVLAFGYWDLAYYLVGKNVPTADVQDVTATVIESALKSAFEGKSVGEFVNWLKTIASRRVADYHRDRERRIDADPLPSEHEGDETLFGPEPADEFDAGEISLRETAYRLLERRQEIHQLVIRLYGPNELGFMALSARETVAKVEELHPGSGMTEANVHQIWKRFKNDLEDESGVGGS
jgi:DNA-directed RNA polymerase specialized sigma24 family protein